MARFDALPCDPQGREGPLCSADQRAGDLIAAMPALDSACGRIYLRPETALATVGALLERPSRFHAAYEAPGGAYADGSVSAVFTFEMDGRLRANEVVLSDGHVVSLNFGCGGDVDGLIEARGLGQLVWPED